MEEYFHREKSRSGKRLHAGAVGIFALGLMFVASAAATVTYLNSTQQVSAQEAAAVAVVTPPLPDLPDPFATTTVEAHAAYVKDLTTGVVLYSLNPDVQLPLASITKVAMALSVSEVLPRSTDITIPYYTAAPDNSEHLSKGDVWTMGDVMNFTLAVSSNDGADILSQAANDAIHAKYPQSPAAGATLWRMNDLARQLGMHNTYFLDDNGLDVSTTQSGAYGSVHDIATLLAYAASTSPDTFKATTMPSFSLTSVNGAHAKATNTDEVLRDIPGVIMSKTGYTDLAGGNLAVVFEASNGHRIVAVILGSTFNGRFSYMKQLVSDTETRLAQSPRY